MLNAVGQAQNILLLGGSSEIGLGIVKEFLSRGSARVILAGRTAEGNLDAAAEQVKAAGASAVELIDFDALNTDAHPEALDKAFSFGDVDVAVVAFGVMGDQEEIWQDHAKAVASSEINYTGYVSVGVLLAERLKKQGHGHIVAFSSIAGWRARRANYVYGSTKAGLDAFCQGLADRLHGTGLGLYLARPGFVIGSMTEGMTPAIMSVRPNDVAEAVAVRIRDNQPGTFWVPKKLALLAAVMKLVPRPIWRRMPR